MTNFWQQLHKPFTVLAPMENVTDMAFREMVTQNLVKPDVLITEFVNCDGIIYNESGKVLEKLKFSEVQRPIVAQIWGTNLENLEKAAKIIEKMGFDGIDINMGCPAKDVMKVGGGAALTKNPKLAVEIIKAVMRGAPNLPVSVKTRLGADFKSLLETGISALTLHGRTPSQMSKGKADWEEIGKLVNLTDHKTIIIGNGDVKSYAEVLDKHKTYGVDGVMIGRGIFKDPFVFAKKPHVLTKEQRIELLEKHIGLIKIHGGVINDFLKMYLKDFDGAKELRMSYLNDIMN